MSRVRFDLEAKLELRAPLHIGTGEARSFEAVKGKTKTEDKTETENPLVALIVRDAMGRPMLPSTALKGMFRGLASSGAGRALSDRLFGQIKDSTDSAADPAGPAGQIGHVTVFSAFRTGGVPDTTQAPWGKDGCFIAARTRIDGASGVAEDAKLFHQEMVAAGTTFCLRCRLEFRGQKTAQAEDSLNAFLPILAMLTQEQGVAFGKGKADGQGRLRLDKDSLKITRFALDDQGVFQGTDYPVV